LKLRESDFIAIHAPLNRETQIGKINCCNTLNVSEGDSVLVAIRPENITFGEEGYRAKIVTSAFIGNALL
jgi:hypothetical protein